MAKIKVMGDTVQICSSLTVDEIKKVSFYKPECLNLVDGNGDAYFGIGVGNAHYSKHGVMFSSRDFEGKAFMTTNNPVTNEHTDRGAEKELLTKTFAGIIANLEAIEEQVYSAMEEISVIEATTANSIEFIDECTCACFDEAAEPEREE